MSLHIQISLLIWISTTLHGPNCWGFKMVQFCRIGPCLQYCFRRKSRFNENSNIEKDCIFEQNYIMNFYVVTFYFCSEGDFIDIYYICHRTRWFLMNGNPDQFLTLKKSFLLWFSIIWREARLKIAKFWNFQESTISIFVVCYLFFSF